MKIKIMIAILCVAMIACGEKNKQTGAKTPAWVTRGALKSNIAKADAKKIYDTQLKKRHQKGSAFRNDEIASADSKMLGFIAGANFAELSIGLALEDKVLIEDAMKGMIELVKRSGNVGNYAWGNDLAGTLTKVDNGSITLKQASDEVDVIAEKFLKAASETNSDFAVQTVAGFKLFSAGLLMGVGKPSNTVSPFLAEYLALTEKNLDEASLASLRQVQTLASAATNEADWNVAGNLLLKTISTLKLG